MEPHKKDKHSEEELDTRIQNDIDVDAEYGVNEIDTPPSPKAGGNPPYLLILLLMAISFFAGYMYFKANSLQEKLNNAQAAAPVAPGQPIAQEVKIDTVKNLFKDGFIKFGDTKRKLLIVEISDPSCPYCHIAAGKNPELSKQVSPQFTYISDGGTYKPPVTEIKKLVDEKKASFVTIFGNGHGNGYLSMQAQYCAFEKGKFWEVHDRLMTNEGYALINEKVKNDKANIPALADYLSKQIDSKFLTSCLESEKYKDEIARDEQLGASLAFQGTPHFILNTKIFGGAQNFNDMQSTVDESLK